ncbi:TrmH family RNA methyltransferase [Paenisporosarcina indica]|uniref:TrmH family RNA methyltransferase n=1 Tax=Paenisporosarcina indica TaxID=650093 RepID=UPI00095017B9|nr:RNA methyltransferase [Paenisporosarcina indica]
MRRIESMQNTQVKHWKKLVTVRKERDKTGEFLVEGFHLVEEALKNQETVLALVVREGMNIPQTWNVDNIEIIEITMDIAKEIAETEHSQGIYAHCSQPKTTIDQQQSWKRLLFVDAVQDPGNVGTMIRTADAAGLDAVILGKGSADAFNPKTVRSGQGSHFHIPVVRGELSEWVQTCKEQNIPVFGTSLDESVVYNHIEPQERFALIMGNEGSGLSPELLVQTDVNLKIPLFGQAESLNVAVATGILLYTLVPIQIES